MGLAVLIRSLCAHAAEIPIPAPPAGATGVVRDVCANHWALGPATSGGLRELLVLPGQDPLRWSAAKIPGLAAAPWQTVVTQRDRGVIVSDGRRAWRFDARVPELGVVEVAISTTDPAPSPTPWRVEARMPASNHDLTGAVLGGRLYVAGGATSDHGFPARTHSFDEIWELDPSTWDWRAVAKFSRPRIYCSTVTFDGQVWVVGGDVLHEDGQRRAAALVEIFDPPTGALVRGPDLPFALPAPLALAAGGRLWVIGSRNRTERGQMASIGPGEKAWRMEPEGLPQMWALAGTALDDKLYVCVPNTGLAVFDPAVRTWSVIPGPTKPRSAQVAAWRGDLWIMGGCDRADWNETWIYRPAERTWRSGPSLPTALAWGAAAVVDDQLIVTGGAWLEGPPENKNYVFSDRTIVLSPDAIPPMAKVAESRPLPRWSDRSLSGTGVTGLPFASERVFPRLRFRRLSTILSMPGEPERLLVAEVDGPVWTFPNRPDVSRADRMLDLPERYKNETHTYALAFDPRFPSMPHVYVLYNRLQPKPAEDVVARFTVSDLDVPVIDVSSEQVLMRWPSDGHNGGDLKFGPDSFLYISTGDGGQPGDLRNMGQRTDVVSGGVLRIDVAHGEGGKTYSVPADNPFIGRPNVLPEYWAYGLRNPWRMAFARTGELWLADNGDDSWESIHLIRKGHNYGWSVFEGSHPFKRNLTLAGPTPHLTPPVIELAHSEARSVIGGLVYQGKPLAQLNDHFVFGDYVTGFVWAFQWDGVAPRNFRRIADTRGQLIAFGTDRAGELLMVRNDGQIHSLAAALPPKAPTRSVPRLLSETGLFASMKIHAPAQGVVPYEINAGVWSDGAEARHLLAVSNWQHIVVGTEEGGRWSLPDGSAVARTLEFATTMGPKRVETQLMYREHGTWQFYTYAWNEAQTDADLIPEAGESRSMPGASSRTRRFSSRGECAVCHTAQTGFTIGLTTAQLNRDTDYSALGRRVENQLSALIETGLLRPALATPLAQLPRRITPADETASLEGRARAYLEINCAHCHRPNGVGGRAAFQLMNDLPLEKTGLVNGQPLVPLLGAEAKLVVPGDPSRSEIFHRLRIKEGGRMPLLGSAQTDESGVELIRRWITDLKP